MNTLYRAFLLLPPEDRKKTLWLIPGVALVAIFQVAGIASISPFMALVTNPSAITDNRVLASLYAFFEFNNPDTFIIWFGCLVLIVLVVGNCVSMLVEWALLRFIWTRNHTVSRLLLFSYLHQPYVFFLNRNSAETSKNLLSESQQVIQGILIPGMRMISHLVVAACTFILLIIVDPYLALLVMSVLCSAYIGIFSLVRRKLSRIGLERVQANEQRYRCASEAMNGIKDIKVLGTENYFLERYSKASSLYSSHVASSNIIAQIPRYALESIAFGGLILIVLYQLAIHGTASEILPVVALYAFAAYRLLPALHEVYGTLSRTRFNQAAIETVEKDLKLQKTMLPPKNRQLTQALPLQHSLQLQQISYSYPNTVTPVFDQLTLDIIANTSVAFVGSTGSGKTTIIDIILGLLLPSGGNLNVDGQIVTDDLIHSWQKSIGYVPQHIYLSDESIVKNIAFGLAEEDIDQDAVVAAAKIACIDEFIAQELPLGYATKVGESGIRLSGGQRQRLGIARALYHDPDVLIFDEATSALDSITEHAIISSLRTLAVRKTIIMIAHRLTTIKHCDNIFVLEKGRVAASGTYNELIEKCEFFRELDNSGASDDNFKSAI